MISIVIPSWNGLELLKKSLPACLQQKGCDFEIILVDNGSSDGTVEYINKHFPQVTSLSLKENTGFSYAVNQGIKAAGQNDVVLLNNDTTPCEGWLLALVQAAEENPDFHLFPSRVLIADFPERIDTVGDGFSIAGFGYKIGWLQDEKCSEIESREVFGGSGCALYIRRSVFETAGLFDEDFFAFGEDLDFSFRARLGGYRVKTVPDARIYHDVRATSSSENTLFWYHRNLIWLLMKNMPWQLLLLYSPHILGHIVLVFIRSVFRGWAWLYLKSLFAAFKGTPDMLKKRKIIQSTRCISLKELARHLDSNWIQVHLDLHDARKKMDLYRSKHRL